MRYRVGKLERMLGPVSTDPDLRLDVAVALKAREVIGH
jgi:purine catabolism regulator